MRISAKKDGGHQRSFFQEVAFKLDWIFRVRIGCSRQREQSVQGHPALETTVTAAQGEGRGGRSLRLDFMLIMRYDGRVCNGRVQV